MLLGGDGRICAPVAFAIGAKGEGIETDRDGNVSIFTYMLSVFCALQARFCSGRIVCLSLLFLVHFF